MRRKLTSRSSVENLKREAKRWLKALRENDADARGRLAAVLPNPPASPSLRDVQRALALDYGYDGWAALTTAIASRPDEGPADESLLALLVAAQDNDTGRIATLLDAHPELADRRGTLRGHTGLRTAMHFGNHHYEVVKLLLDRGADPNIRDDGDNAYPLHFVAERLELRTAAWMDAANAIQVLVERGAHVDRRDDNHGSTALGFAVYGQKARAAEVLRHHGNDVWNLALLGSVDRLRIALAERPALARAAWPDEQITPLMRLPGDPDAALEVATLLVAHGADPHHRNREGQTAIDLAERRGLIDVATFLRRSAEIG